jgi:hypothetical protein
MDKWTNWKTGRNGCALFLFYSDVRRAELELARFAQKMGVFWYFRQLES